MIFSDVQKKFIERKLSLKKNCHILEEMDERKNKTQFSYECEERKFAWHQMRLCHDEYFSSSSSSHPRNQAQTRRIYFISHKYFFATYCNILSVNNEMKMRCCRFCNML